MPPVAPSSSILDTLSAIEARRSVKHYEPDFVMPAEHVALLKHAAMLSPTSFNMQNWRFVWVDDADLRQQLKAAAWGQSQVTDASLLVILCADLKAFEKSPERYWREAPEAVQNQIVPMIVKTYQGREQLQRDEAMRSIAIASQTLMLASKALGYDSCPMVGFDPLKVAQLIALPADHVVGLMLTIGKAKVPAQPRSGQLAESEVWIHNRF
ncbi:MAG: nitroreductase family protein [Vampirovibrionales bacterium]|nr:nitroreductase family protein [Vampirovibrionales bacterium]